ncbi:hypothetical protein KEJ47_00820 [Candidatus Bathyarchaeota archaeon]|nr:hypothetical protein [Candidatus Bathyarchaeota archaeon]
MGGRINKAKTKQAFNRMKTDSSDSLFLSLLFILVKSIKYFLWADKDNLARKTNNDFEYFLKNKSEDPEYLMI